MKRFETAFKGRLLYEITGAQPEAILNACAAEGVPFSDVLSGAAGAAVSADASSGGAAATAAGRTTGCASSAAVVAGGKSDCRPLAKKRSTPMHRKTAMASTSSSPPRERW